MQTAIAALPPFHPRVIQASYKPLMAALVPRYVAAFNQVTTLPNPKRTPEAIAQGFLRRSLKLLVKHQGCVPVSKALSHILSGDEARELTDTQAGTSVRLLELLMECSELIVTDCDGSTFSLHPEWSRRFCERYAEQEGKTLAMTAHWGTLTKGQACSTSVPNNPHY